MKYLFIFLFIITFISPSVDKGYSSNIIRSSVYNYITSLDRAKDYFVENVSFFSKLSKLSYKKAYDNVMKDRILVKHLVLSGETLDDIIKIYNSDIENIEYFRLVALNENPDTISKDYQISYGDYILVPSE
ncbi:MULTISPECIES: hypothetical protein [Romboutsia]|uniref:LysM domain-containing protein n=1 Tax=Romboutsia hominis TaxID=1507512 RepID=A0A2P2BPP6_9FIRM|nr:MULTISPECIES: hypothetical protein [Romboutsia]MCH1959642.1 hypothetical protein [Romboutsia hominis]MCH1969935.1 hypothetical protein [Romboutsia hominis]MDB8803844.1 hypothetical protein [Romboutsia sp. 1001216sp1]MDB8806806.1 hypothetical protein [Romboutsia sp. 1001216sp1]MDB8809491.1 hypothetical protein [Romboutsia sp. 1001216sp1]